MSQQVAPPLILTGGISAPSETPFLPEEIAIFDRDLERLAYMASLSADLRNLLLSDRDAFLVAAQVAKSTLGTNLVFAGISASSPAQLGMQLIRAITVRNPGITSGTPVQNWIQSYSSTGWTNIFGSPATPVSLAQTGLGGSSATNLQNKVVLAFGALIDPTPSPKIAEYRFHVGATDYQVHSISWQPLTNLFYAKLEGMFLVTKNQSFYMRGNIQPSTGQDNTQLFGLTFATGDYLTYET
jgi:hypothetical protein